jgi:hypothetical protein
VILSGFSGGAYQYSNGISVFFPWSLEGYEASKKNFQELWLTKDIKFANQESETKWLYWGDFLKKYLTDVARRRAEPYTIHALPGKKIIRPSGIKFSDQPHADLHLSTRQAGLEGSKQAGLEGSKQAGLEGSKQAGLEGSKQAGLEGSKMGGGTSNALFANLKLWKNIETHHDIYGFTKHEPEADTDENAYAQEYGS